MSTNGPSRASPTAVEAVRTLVETFELLRYELTQALAFEGLAVSPLHMRVLMWCQQFPGTNQQVMGDAIGRDKSHVARLVKELEAKGLMTREDDPHDKRSYTLRPTAAGESACRVFERVESTLAKRMFSGTPAEALRGLVEVTRAARDHLGKSGTRGGGLTLS